MELQYLSLSDVLAVGLTFDEIVSVIEQSLREHGEKQVENPQRYYRPVKRTGALFKLNNFLFDLFY